MGNPLSSSLSQKCMDNINDTNWGCIKSSVEQTGRSFFTIKVKVKEANNFLEDKHCQAKNWEIISSANRYMIKL